MLYRYQRFIDKYGKIIFPLYFLFLFLLFIVPNFYIVPKQQYISDANIANAKNFTQRFTAFFYKSIVSPLTVYTGYCKSVAESEYIASKYPTFLDYLSSHYGVLILQIAFCILSLAIIICTIVFICYLFKNKKTIKPLLIVVPLLYLCQSIIALVIYSLDWPAYVVVPFLGFYISFILCVMAVLYCVKCKEPPQLLEHLEKSKDRPKLKKPRKPTKAERIAELERQVAELQAEREKTNE